MAKKAKQPVQHPTPSRIHEIKITIKDSKPPIWRTVAVPSDIRLSDLHMVIQVVMGWCNSHLHQFILHNKRKPTAAELTELFLAKKQRELARLMARERYFSLPEFELEDAEDERKVRLNELVPAVKNKLEYEYDFGDSWVHMIEVVKVGPPADGVIYPICLKGKFAGPPEDCHGIMGYYDMLEAIKDPRHPQHEELKEWLGPFDPDYFDLKETNEVLAQLPIEP